jgi:predicted ATPase
MRVDERPVRRLARAPGFRARYEDWPASIPAVAQLLKRGLSLPAGLTVLVGENGSGKSTLLELLAAAYGLNPQGGSRGSQFRTRASEPELGAQLEVERGLNPPRWAYFLRADTTHGVFSYLEENPGNDPTFHELSHGESFLALVNSRMDERGFYLLDEPDAPLSFTASLALVATLEDLVKSGSQVVVATHSPVVAAAPSAHLLEIGDWGIRETSWDDLDLVQSWRDFLSHREAFLRALLPPPPETEYGSP